MNQFGATTFTGNASCEQAATDASHFVRLGELETLLSAKAAAAHTHTTVEVSGLGSYVDGRVTALFENSDTLTISIGESSGKLSGAVRLKVNGALAADGNGLYVMVGSGSSEVAAGDHAHAEFHDPVSVVSSASVNLAVNGQELSADVVLMSFGGLQATPSGLAIEWGTGENQVPRGNHTHTGLELAHAALTVSNTASVQLTVSPEQLLSATVLCGYGLQVTASGIEADFGTGENQVARGNHTHDGLEQAHSAVTVASSSSVNLTLDEQALSAEVRVGYGLKITSSGVEADYGTGLNQTARGNHTHSGLELAHNQVTLGASSSVSLALDEQQLSAEVRLPDADSGMMITASGLALNWGSGSDQVPRGDHTHAQLHDAVTLQATDSLALGITAGQQLSGVVRLDPAPGSGKGRIGVTSNGLYVVLGTGSDTAAAGDHSHDLATPTSDGMMSAEDKARLDAVTSDIDGTVKAAVNSVVSVVNFSRESLLGVGQYVGGRMRWPQSMEITAVNLVALAPKQNLWLTLELNGQRTATTVLIPSGVENTEVFKDVNFSGVFLTASGVNTPFVRWICSSGTGPIYESASMIYLAMSVRPAIDGNTLIPPAFQP